MAMQRTLLPMILAMAVSLVLPARASEESEAWAWTCTMEPGWDRPHVEMSAGGPTSFPTQADGEDGEAHRFPLKAWAFNVRGEPALDRSGRNRVAEATVAWFTEDGEVADVLRLQADTEAWVSEDGSVVVHARLIPGEYDIRAGDQPMTNVTCQRGDGVLLWQRMLSHGRYALSPTGETVVRLTVDAAEVYTVEGELLTRVRGMFMRDDVFFNQSDTRILLLRGGWNAQLRQQASTIAVCLDSHGETLWQSDLGPTDSATASWLSDSESVCIAYTPSPVGDDAPPPPAAVVIDGEGNDVARHAFDGEPVHLMTSPDGSRVLVAIAGRRPREPRRLVSLESSTLALEYAVDIPSDYSVSGVAAGTAGRAAVAIACSSDLSGEVIFFDGESFVGRIRAAAAPVDWVAVSDDQEYVLFGRRWASGDGNAFVQVAPWQ